MQSCINYLFNAPMFETVFHWKEHRTVNLTPPLIYIYLGARRRVRDKIKLKQRSW